jgi:hypothetical protein
MTRVISLLIVLQSLTPFAANLLKTAPASALNFTAMAVSMSGLQSTLRSNNMCAESLSTGDFDALQKTLAAVIASARSLDEIEAWLTSQQCVKSVQLENYLLKSNPPQRDFTVEFRMENGSTVKKIINIFDLGNQQFRFHKLRDQ